MLRLINHYCSECLRTTRFLDTGPHLVCECCTKRLVRVQAEMETVTATAPKASAKPSAQEWPKSKEAMG